MYISVVKIFKTIRVVVTFNCLGSHLTKPELSLLAGLLLFLMQDISCSKCGSVNDYEIRQGLHQTAYCNGCGSYIKHLPKLDKELVIYFGKFKGTALKDFVSKDHVSWLNWALNNTTNFKPHETEKILKHLSGI